MNRQLFIDVTDFCANESPLSAQSKQARQKSGGLFKLFLSKCFAKLYNKHTADGKTINLGNHCPCDRANLEKSVKRCHKENAV